MAGVGVLDRVGMTAFTSYEQATVAAFVQGADGMWASQDHHRRDMWPITGRGGRPKCPCGCGRRATHIGGCNALGLRSGCEFSIRRWMRGTSERVDG